MPINRAVKAIVYSLSTLILGLAFVVSAIRRTFWILATLPVTGYRAYKSGKSTKGHLLLCLSLILLAIYQPFVQLPSNGFIGFLEKMEVHLNRLMLDSEGELTLAYKDVPKEPVSVPKEYGDYFLFGTNTLTPVRPPQGSTDVAKDYFVARGALVGTNTVTSSINARTMVDMFPYEPIPDSTVRFSAFTKPITDIASHDRVPYPKHMLFVLVGFALYTLFTSTVFTWLFRRLFVH